MKSKQLLKATLTTTKIRRFITPRNVTVSSEHVISHFDYSDRVRFPITLGVESYLLARWVIIGEMVTQLQMFHISHSRFQKLLQHTFIRFVV